MILIALFVHLKEETESSGSIYPPSAQGGSEIVEFLKSIQADLMMLLSGVDKRITHVNRVTSMKRWLPVSRRVAFKLLLSHIKHLMDFYDFHIIV